MANKKRGRTASETSSGLGSVPSSAGPGSSGGSAFSGSFLGKQFSFASGGKSGNGNGNGNSIDVISTQPSRPTQDEPLTASSAVQPGSSVSDSVNTITDTNTDKAAGGYKPVTNFEPQERVNPFDKEPHKSTSVASIAGAASNNTTSSSSSISSSSISSRINRNGNSIKSPPPPSGPPPPPPTVATVHSNANSSSGYRNSFSSTLSKDKTSYGNYGSSTSIETITRMDTNTTNTAATATGAGEASGITAITAITSISNSAAGTVGGAVAPPTTVGAMTTSATTNDWRSAIGIRSASVYSAPAAVTTTALPGDTSGYDSNSIASQAEYNNPSDLPSYTRPSYARSESNASRSSDLDIIFGDPKSTSNTNASYGNGKFTRASGSISDADMIFGGPPSNYKTDRFGAAKSMSMSSSGVGSGSGPGVGSYKTYEGIQNAAFSDFSDTGSMSSMGSATRRWSAAREDDDEIDLK